MLAGMLQRRPDADHCLRDAGADDHADHHLRDAGADADRSGDGHAHSDPYAHGQRQPDVRGEPDIAGRGLHRQRQQQGLLRRGGRERAIRRLLRGAAVQRRLEAGQYTLPDGGKVGAYYKNAAGSLITIAEGAYCTTSPAACSPHISVIGPASFGGLSGTLDVLAAGPIWAIFAAPGTMHAYVMIGQGMSQAQFVAWAAAVRKVPRP